MIHLRSCGRVLSKTEELAAVWLISSLFLPVKVTKIISIVCFFFQFVYWDQKILADSVHIVPCQAIFVGLRD